jgi:hypothetical protein
MYSKKIKNISNVVIVAIIIFDIWVLFFSDLKSSPSSLDIRLLSYSIYSTLLIILFNSIIKYISSIIEKRTLNENKSIVFSYILIVTIIVLYIYSLFFSNLNDTSNLHSSFFYFIIITFIVLLLNFLYNIKNNNIDMNNFLMNPFMMTFLIISLSHFTIPFIFLYISFIITFIFKK